MLFCGLFMDLRGCCYELSFSAKHQELHEGREPQAAQGILGVSSQSLWPTEESSSSCSTRGWLEFTREVLLSQMT